MATTTSLCTHLSDVGCESVLTNNYALINSDCVDAMKPMQDAFFDLIFADPPYFLSSGGTSCSGGKRVPVDKGDWDRARGPEEVHNFNMRWLTESYRILKDTGSIFVCGSFHNIFDVGICLTEIGFQIRNMITWQKTNPPPNLACRSFKHSTEFIIWAVKDKSKYFFNYDLMKELNGGKQMTDVWTGALTPRSEKHFGKHPTQKPTYLLDRIIQAASQQGDWVLDPFCGSGTTGVVAAQNSRNFVGIDISNEYIELSRNRINHEMNVIVE